MQAFLGELVFQLVGRDEKRAPIKTPAWEAKAACDYNLLLVDCHVTRLLYKIQSHNLLKTIVNSFYLLPPRQLLALSS